MVKEEVTKNNRREEIVDKETKIKGDQETKIKIKSNLKEITMRSHLEVIEVVAEAEVNKDQDAHRPQSSLRFQRKEEKADHLLNSKKMLTISLKEEKKIEMSLNLVHLMHLNLVKTP